jgi:argininosuccinate lyase
LERLPELDACIEGLQSTLVTLAERNRSVLMPAYTHMQRAQPVTFSHWLLSHFWALQRDRQRLADLRKRVSIMPLGCAALAGTAYPVDRHALAMQLGFDLPAPNSLDAVSDRDFAAEYLFCTALVGVHLSKLAENVILFTTAEFGFFELADAFSTGSSLMPQKKNPDVFELTRGKAGTLIGLLIGLMSTLKGLPSAYDKDLQEDKQPVFQATDTLLAVLPVISKALETMTVKEKQMLAAIDTSMLATDLADYLVRKGVSFREAHGMVGKAVHLAAEKGLSLDGLPLDDFQALGPFAEDVYKVFDPMKAVERRNVYGGTSPQSVEKQLHEAKSIIEGE